MFGLPRLRKQPGTVPAANDRSPDRIPSCCCAVSSSPYCVGSTACCKATIERCSAASASIWRTCASISCMTTCAISTGTSPRVRRHRTCANFRKTARSPRGSCSTCRVRSTSGRTAKRKRELSSELVAVLARLFARHGNRVGALLHTHRADEMIPARNGRRHVLHVLDRMLRTGSAPAGQETNLASCWRWRIR